MNPNEYLESVLATNPVTAPFFIASKIIQGKKDEKGDKGGPSQPPSGEPPAGKTPPASTTTESSTDNSPKQQPVPPGGASGAGLPALLETLIKLQTQEAEAARKYYPEKARIDIETYRQQADIAERAGMEKMREKTARDIELQTINAWQNITQAQINRDTAMGLGMMNLAYAAGVPNPNVLQAGASLAGQGRAGFGVPFSYLGELEKDVIVPAILNR